jgi:hypothetical protein
VSGLGFSKELGLTYMNEIYAALVGASVSALLMVLANRSSRRQGDIREIFSRLNSLEREVTRLEANKPRNWRGH